MGGGQWPCLRRVGRQVCLPQVVCAPWVLRSGPCRAHPFLTSLLAVRHSWGWVCLPGRWARSHTPFPPGCLSPALRGLPPPRSSPLPDFFRAPTAGAPLLSQNSTLSLNNRSPLLFPRPRRRWESGQRRDGGGRELGRDGNLVPKTYIQRRNCSNER